MDYRPVALKRFPRLSERQTAENKYWDKLKYPIVAKEFSAVTSVNFCPVAPFNFAVTSSLKVQLYSSVTNRLKRSISRFKDTAYSASFRNDGSLLVAGCETKEIQVFDMGSRAILRTFKGHDRAVRRTQFTPDGLFVASGSDDGTVRTWDLTAETELLTLEGHTDYVRASDVCSSASHILLSGSYDHTAKMWDTRAGRQVLSVDHGAPVESVLMFPGGSSFITAGSNYIKVWDALGKARALHTFSNHQKTITCLRFDSTFTRLLSGSLDRQVKIYDVKDYRVLHSIKYSAPILSLALSPSDSHLVVGAATGMLAIRHRAAVKGRAETNRKREARPGTYRYFVRGHDHKATAIDQKVEVKKRKRLLQYDKLLKRFRYAEALDSVLKTAASPVVVTSFLQELIYRSALKLALAGRDETTLKPVLSFVAKHITNPRFASILIDTGTMILDLYGPVMGQSPAIDECFVKLQQKLQSELKFQQHLYELLGQMDLLLASQEQGETPQ